MNGHRLIAIAFWIALAFGLAQEPTPKPSTPILASRVAPLTPESGKKPVLSVEDQLAVTREILAASSAENELRRAQQAATEANGRLEKAQDRLRVMIPSILKKLGVPHCAINLQAEVVCPEPPKAEPPKAEPPKPKQ